MEYPDSEAEFLQILNQCRGSIFKVCLLYTDRTQEAVEDLFQDICCNLWEAFTRYHRDSTANTWVYVVALQTAKYQLRRRMRQPRFVELDKSLYETVADVAEDEEVREMYEMIDRLPDEEKTLLLMYIDRVPQREIAQILGTTEDAVNHRIYRLKLKLKQMNDDENDR